MFSGATVCEINHYCPPGSSAAIPCPAGTSSQAGMGDLLNCIAGVAGTANPLGTSIACSKGHYCPSGTKNPYDFPCPPGTFTDLTNVPASSRCTDCPVGKACSIMSTTAVVAITYTSSIITFNTNAIQNCAAGHFCPVRTDFPTQFPCLAGTFSASTGLGLASECTTCTIGKW